MRRIRVIGIGPKVFAAMQQVYLDIEGDLETLS
ncbi:MAG: hypothetical protein QOH68_3776 [Nocardioidaceae bacterium]|jgi:hypothetical protein|nr:hypothetical protein [Nocardioidaceae bacterium]